MRRIVFTSRASRPYGRLDIADLCNEASKRNEVDDVTGLFLFDGTRFLQALEGEDDVIAATMARIDADDRHFDIVRILSEPTETREFSEWTMSQPLYGIGDDPEAYVERIKHEVRNVRSAYIRAQCIGFANLAKTARYRYE